MIGQAQTGSGKTAAFGLPMLQYVDPDEGDVQGLVLTPTRELCIQVTQALRAYGKRKGVDVVAVFGGAPIRSQQAQLRAGGQVVVGTVGRVKDLISRHSLMLHACRFVVLDEADEMLDLGFLEDVERILALTPSSRQTALFSATMPPEIRRLADQYLYDPITIKVKTATLTVDTVEQFALEVKPRDKTEALVQVLEDERPDQALIFVRTKIRADQLFRTLRDRGMNVRALHGDMTQGSRDGVMIAFKGGSVPLLVATDVAARGLDISGISHVINYDVPSRPTSTSIASAAPAGSGAAGVPSPSTSRARSVTSRRSSATPASSSRHGSRTPMSRPPRSRARRAGTPSRAFRRTPTATRRCARSSSPAAGPRGSSPRTSSTPSPVPPTSTASPCAMSACWSASRSPRCPRTRRSGSSIRPVAPRFAATCCASSWPAPERRRRRAATCCGAGCKKSPR